jgi:hypothetical protein
MVLEPPPEEEDDAENGFEVKFPINTKMGNGLKAEYPSSIHSIFSKTVGLSRYTSERADGVEDIRVFEADGLDGIGTTFDNRTS